MPEGDSVATHAERLKPVLTGAEIVVVGGTARSVRSNSRHILDATVEDIRTVGKNLLIDLSTGYSIRVHLGMSGRWRILQSGEKAHGAARLLLDTGAHRVACFAAPTVQVDRTPVIDAELEPLGPDLLGDFDAGEFSRRARLSPDRPIGDVLLDQRVIAGIGNVYKSELLFLERINPHAPVGRLDDNVFAAIAERARRLLAANVGRGGRTTTGSRAPGRQTWVYERSGRPCRRCGRRIEQGRQSGRVIYWCPGCQPL